MIEERTEEILAYPTSAQVKKPRAADGEKLAKKPPTKPRKCAGMHLHFVQIPLQFLLKLPLEAF